MEESWSAILTRPLPRRPPAASWHPVGALAAAVASRPHRWADDVRKLLRFCNPRAIALDSGDLAKARNLLPRVEEGHVVVSWLLDSKQAAVRVSTLSGAWFGTLRLCAHRRCPTVFLAPTRSHPTCELHTWSRAHMSADKRRIWDLVKDRLRKQRGGAEMIGEALADLRVMQLLAWRKKYDVRAPQGRPRKLRTMRLRDRKER